MNEKYVLVFESPCSDEIVCKEVRGLLVSLMATTFTFRCEKESK